VSSRAPLLLGVALAAVSWAAVWIVLCSAPSSAVAFYRLAIAVLVLTPFLPGASLRALREASPGTLLAVAGAGVLLAAHLVLWIASLRLTTVASSMFLLASQGAFAVLASRLVLGERTPPRVLLGCVLATLGSATIGLADFRFDTGDLLGDLLAIGSAVAFVGYLLVGRRFRQKLPIVPWLWLLYATAALAVLPLCLIEGAPLSGYPTRDWLLLLALALVPTIVGHGLLNYALRELPVPVVNMAPLSEPFLAALLAWWILHQAPSPWVWLGGALVGAGGALALLRERRVVEEPT
jgi:drug/metabolite transporter (DMT)-like permease